MASGAMCRQLGVAICTGNYSLVRSIRVQQKQFRRGSRLLCARLQYCTSASSSTTQGVDVRYENGLPVLLVPLPSREERCQFTLRPVSNTLGDLTNFLRQEDHGIDRVAVYNKDGVRIAQSTPIETLLRSQFTLCLNDKTYTVSCPEPVITSSEHMHQLSDVKNSIAQLYSQLNVEEHQLSRERDLVAELERLKAEIEPLEKKRQLLAEKAWKRTNRLSWLALGAMGLQFGILARLTWWEYSWDIMEPVTYFVTYGTSMIMCAYYVLTKQEYNFKEVRDREYLITLHRQAKKVGLDIDHYNRLRDGISQAEYDLERLRDPLQLQLPIQHLLKYKKKPEDQPKDQPKDQLQDQSQ